MTAPELKGVIEAGSATLTNWNTIVDRLTSIEGPNGAVFEIEKPIPNLVPTTSIQQMSTKLSGAIGLVHNLSGIESLDLIPDSIVTEVSARVGSVRAVVEKLLAHINSLESDSEIVSLDAESMIAANQKSQQINLPPIFVELYPAIQNLFVTLYQMRAMSELSEEGGYALQISQINAARSAQQRAYGELNRLRRALGATQKKLDNIISEAGLASEEVAAVKKQSADIVKGVEESKAKAEALIAASSAINDTATTLKASIDGYQIAFNKFQADLDQRNDTFVKGKADLDNLLAESAAERAKFLTEGQSRLDQLLAESKAEQDRLLVEKKAAHEHLVSEKLTSYEKLQSDIGAAKAEMDRLLARSREVLGEATVSGLSDSFAREMRGTRNQLRWIQLLFFFSVACLLVAAGIVLNAFPWVEKWVHIVRFEPPANADPTAIALFYVGNFVSKLTFLLPPLILLLFAGRRYTELFRLKTQYTYKYAVAASLPGFKVEAPNFADAITALAFKELLFNPGERINAPEEKSDNAGELTFIQRMLEPIIKKAMDKMGEVWPAPGSEDTELGVLMEPEV